MKTELDHLCFLYLYAPVVVSHKMLTTHCRFLEVGVKVIVLMTGEHFTEVKWQNSTSPMCCADSSELMLSAGRGSKD